jgi:hypothetical protein
MEGGYHCFFYEITPAFICRDREAYTGYPKHGRDSNWMELKRIIMVFTTAHHWT